MRDVSVPRDAEVVPSDAKVSEWNCTVHQTLFAVSTEDCAAVVGVLESVVAIVVNNGEHAVVAVHVVQDVEVPVAFPKVLPHEANPR